MTRPTDEELIAFVDGQLNESDMKRVLEAVEQDPELAGNLRRAAAGQAALRYAYPAVLPDVPAPTAAPPGSVVTKRTPRGVRPWYVPLAAAATLLVTVPATWYTASMRGASTETTAVSEIGIPTAAEQGFMLVLHGRWPDAASTDESETRRRAREYWTWTNTLADSGILMGAGDLRWEPGFKMSATGASEVRSVESVSSADFVVGVFALRARSYKEALAIAQRCPHLKYGGSVSVRQIAGGFFAPRRP